MLLIDKVSKHFFHQTQNHVCTLEDSTSNSFLPPLKNDNYLTRVLRAFRKTILITEKSPQSLEYYRTNMEIMNERRKQVESNSCVIHPFSIFRWDLNIIIYFIQNGIFRTFYEVWMIFIYSCCLFFMPLDAAFDHVFSSNVYVGFDYFFNVFSLMDVFMRFCTGYTIREEKRVVLNLFGIIRLVYRAQN